MRSKYKIDLIVKIDGLNWKKKKFNIGVTNFNIFPIIGAPYELFKSFPLFICEFYNSSCRLPIPHKIGYLFLMPDFGPSWPMIKVDSLSKFQVSQHKAHTHSLSLSLSLSLSSMASSFSSALNHSWCGISLRLLFGKKPQASFSRCFHHCARWPLQETFPLTLTLSRSFSQAQLSEGPSLRHFIAQASLTASKAQPKWVTFYSNNVLYFFFSSTCISLFL